MERIGHTLAGEAGEGGSDIPAGLGDQQLPRRYGEAVTLGDPDNRGEVGRAHGPDRHERSCGGAGSLHEGSLPQIGDKGKCNY